MQVRAFLLGEKAMNDKQSDLNVSTMSDQWITDHYCKELLKAKASLHFQGKIDLGQADRDLMKRCKQELKRRSLIIPHLNFRVSFP
jgi:hypothetical protein